MERFAVTGVLGFVLAGHRGQFVAALHSAPISFLAASVALQIAALLAHTEAWHICVSAAGGSRHPTATVPRGRGRLLVSVLNGSLGMAPRIGSLRQEAGDGAAGVHAAGRRGPDHRGRGRPHGHLLLHADRAARCGLVGADHRRRGAGRGARWAAPVRIVAGPGRGPAWQ